LNEIPAQRGTTPTDSFTDSIVLSGSIAVRSALRATGKDQQEDQKKGYLLSTLMSSFDNPSLQDGRNKGILPSDEVISVADEKDGHSVSLLFLSFNQERFDCRFVRQPLFLFYSSSTSASSIAPFISTDTCSIFLNIFLNPLSIPSHRPTPTVPLLFLIRIILSIMSILV
jgi:hypothetical protein